MVVLVFVQLIARRKFELKLKHQGIAQKLFLVVKTSHSILHAINFHFHHEKKFNAIFEAFLCSPFGSVELSMKSCAPQKRNLNSKNFRLKKTGPEEKMGKNWCEKVFCWRKNHLKNEKNMKTNEGTVKETQWKFQIWILWKKKNNFSFLEKGEKCKRSSLSGF